MARDRHQNLSEEEKEKLHESSCTNREKTVM